MPRGYRSPRQHQLQSMNPPVPEVTVLIQRITKEAFTFVRAFSERIARNFLHEFESELSVSERRLSHCPAVGVSRHRSFDPDFIDVPNLNRTVGATRADVIAKTPKVEVAERMVKSANPDAEVWAIQTEWQKDFDSLRACDVVFGCLDGFSQRAQLEESCRRALIPLIDIGMDVHKSDPYSISGQLVVSLPG